MLPPSLRASWNVNDAFEADLRARGGGRELARLFEILAANSLFVSPEVARGRGAVFPKTARAVFGKHRTGEVDGGIRYWNNQPASYAFFAALGSNINRFAGFNVCHLYPRTVGDPRHFTQLANMVVVPRSLWRFTDWGVVLEVLQRRSFELFGYGGPRKREPPVPPLYPDAWPEPEPPDDVLKVRRFLDHLTATRPMYLNPRGKGKPHAARPPANAGTQEARAPDPWDRPAQPPEVKRGGARDLEAEFWVQARADAATLRLLCGWVVRHSYFAPRRVVEEVGNPFPRCRRCRIQAGERPRRVVDGVVLATNTAAAYALLLAIGRPLYHTAGGVVDHAWPAATQVPAHFCHLGGLALFPAALGSLVDAPPVRALVERELFERTGYAGPAGKPPAPSPLMPREWPENVELGPGEEAAIVDRLKRLRRERPGFYPGALPAAPAGRG